MKCIRCNKNDIQMGTGYPHYFSMDWGHLTITLSDAPLCRECTNELFSKISEALMNDKGR